jgi:hypothetical protein
LETLHKTVLLFLLTSVYCSIKREPRNPSTTLLCVVKAEIKEGKGIHSMRSKYLTFWHFRRKTMLARHEMNENLSVTVVGKVPGSTT